MAKVETIAFTVDPAIIHHTIHSQAGTLGKAIVELVQNAVDAGASRCDITIDRDGFAIQDNGKGFASRSEIENYFAKFGTPHSDGDATFGRFRIGRGQIMTFAETRWLSGAFCMDVDLKNRGLRFDLTDTNPVIPGCRIEGSWYEPLVVLIPEYDENDYFGDPDPEPDPYATLLLELKKTLRYVRIEVCLNGERISVDPGTQDWTVENDTAYFLLKASGTLAIYNQGVLVREDPGYFYGCGGVIVTKKNILLNVSRTEILRKQCPVWPVIEKEINRQGRIFRNVKNSSRSDENSRKHAAQALRRGQGDIGAPVITLLPRKHVSMSILGFSNDRPLVVAPPNDLVRAERISRSGMAMVLHPSVLDRFGAGTAEELGKILKEAWLNDNNDHPYFVRDRDGKESLSAEYRQMALENARQRRINYASIWEFPDYEEMASAFNGDSSLITVKDLLKTDEVIYRAVIQPLDGFIFRIQKQLHGMSQISTMDHTKVVIGRSDSHEAWTDGKSYLAVSEQLLHGVVTNGFAGILHLLDVVVHEIAHFGYGETQDAPHDEVFYASFHDITLFCQEEKAKAVDLIIGNYLAICKRDKIKPGQWAKKWMPKRVAS